MKTFTYEKANGDVSVRTVVPIHPASASMLAIDLSEYEPDERIYYAREVERLQEEFKQEIESLGLGTNWRNFRNDRIK